MMQVITDVYYGALRDIGLRLTVLAARRQSNPPAFRRLSSVARFFLEAYFREFNSREEARRLARKSFGRLVAVGKLTTIEASALYITATPGLEMPEDIHPSSIPPLLRRAAAKLGDDEIAAFDLVRTADGGLERAKVVTLHGHERDEADAAGALNA